MHDLEREKQREQQRRTDRSEDIAREENREKKREAEDKIITASKDEPNAKGEVIGYIIENDKKYPNPNSPFKLSEAHINKHIFICGNTGFGKTTTIFNILKNCKVPFLILEPPKSEDYQPDYAIEGYSISEFQQKYRMKYPAALLTIDWIIKEPEKAIQSIKQGIK